MKWKFYAKAGHCLHVPGLKATGQASPYVGRDFVAGDAEKGVAASHPASKEPVEVDSDSDLGKRIARKFQVDANDPPLWPADKATATALSAVFVEVERDGDEFKPKAAKASGKAE